MDGIYRETLRKVEQNDYTLTTLSIKSCDDHNIGTGTFFSENNTDYSRLGSSIAENSNIEHLDVSFNGLVSHYHPTLEVTNDAFFNGLKRNSSISKVTLRCGRRVLAGGVFHEILNAYQENNEHITYLQIRSADVQNGGENAIADTLRCCTNIQELDLQNVVSGIDNNDSMDRRQRLVPLVKAIRGHCSLENLSLENCQVGSVDQCEVLATLLSDPNSILQSLNLRTNIIGIEGANVIINSLANNTKLRKLYLTLNRTDRYEAAKNFYTLLCNTSSINDIHSSNHSLEEVSFESYCHVDMLSLELMNRNTNKNYVAIKKILKYHPIDMEHSMLGIQKMNKH